MSNDDLCTCKHPKGKHWGNTHEGLVMCEVPLCDCSQFAREDVPETFGGQTAEELRLSAASFRRMADRALRDRDQAQRDTEMWREYFSQAEAKYGLAVRERDALQKQLDKIESRIMDVTTYLESEEENDRRSISTLVFAMACARKALDEAVAEPAEKKSHEYVGNLCSGFGGETKCQWWDPETRQRCGKSPAAHSAEFQKLFGEVKTDE